MRNVTILLTVSILLLVPINASISQVACRFHQSVQWVDLKKDTLLEAEFFGNHDQVNSMSWSCIKNMDTRQSCEFMPEDFNAPIIEANRLTPDSKYNYTLTIFDNDGVSTSCSTTVETRHEGSSVHKLHLTGTHNAFGFINQQLLSQVFECKADVTNDNIKYTIEIHNMERRAEPKRSQIIEHNGVLEVAQDYFKKDSGYYVSCRASLVGSYPVYEAFVEVFLQTSNVETDQINLQVVSDRDIHAFDTLVSFKVNSPQHLSCQFGYINDWGFLPIGLKQKIKNKDGDLVIKHILPLMSATQTQIVVSAKCEDFRGQQSESTQVIETGETGGAALYDYQRHAKNIVEYLDANHWQNQLETADLMNYYYLFKLQEEDSDRRTILQHLFKQIDVNFQCKYQYNEDYQLISMLAEITNVIIQDSSTVLQYDDMLINGLLAAVKKIMDMGSSYLLSDGTYHTHSPTYIGSPIDHNTFEKYVYTIQQIAGYVLKSDQIISSDVNDKSDFEKIHAPSLIQALDTLMHSATNRYVASRVFTENNEGEHDGYAIENDVFNLQFTQISSTIMHTEGMTLTQQQGDHSELWSQDFTEVIIPPLDASHDEEIVAGFYTVILMTIKNEHLMQTLGEYFTGNIPKHSFEVAVYQSSSSVAHNCHNTCVLCPKFLRFRKYQDMLTKHQLFGLENMDSERATVIWNQVSQKPLVVMNLQMAQFSSNPNFFEENVCGYIDQESYGLIYEAKCSDNALKMFQKKDYVTCCGPKFSTFVVVNTNMITETQLLEIVDSPAKSVVGVFFLCLILGVVAQCLDMQKRCKYTAPRGIDAMIIGIKKTNTFSDTTKIVNEVLKPSEQLQSSVKEGNKFQSITEQLETENCDVEEVKQAQPSSQRANKYLQDDDDDPSPSGRQTVRAINQKKLQTARGGSHIQGPDDESPVEFVRQAENNKNVQTVYQYFSYCHIFCNAYRFYSRSMNIFVSFMDVPRTSKVLLFGQTLIIGLAIVALSSEDSESESIILAFIAMRIIQFAGHFGLGMLHQIQLRSIKIFFTIILISSVVSCGLMTAQYLEYVYPLGKESRLIDLLFIELIVWDICLQAPMLTLAWVISPNKISYWFPALIAVPIRCKVPEKTLTLPHGKQIQK